MVVARCDVGSLSGKAVILKDVEILSSTVVPVTVRPERTAINAVPETVGKAYLKLAGGCKMMSAVSSA